MFLNQGTRQPEASQEEKVNGDMASAWEELDDVQLATVVGGTDILNLISVKRNPIGVLNSGNSSADNIGVEVKF